MAICAYTEDTSEHIAKTFVAVMLQFSADICASAGSALLAYL